MKQRAFLIATVVTLGLASLVVAQDHRVQAVIGNVFLQDTTPGDAQIGHANIKGTFRAGQVNVTSVNSTIPFIGNNNATAVGSIGASFSSAGQDGIAVRGTATNTTGFGRGVYGESRGASGVGVQGHATAGVGVEGRAFGPAGVGVRALSQIFDAPALQAWNLSNGVAARFDGRVNGFNSDGEKVYGFTPSATGTDFRIHSEAVSDFVAMVATNSSVLFFMERDGDLGVHMTVNSNHQGVITADVKNFVQPDPDNVERDIVYASVEGPEAAAYVRGTAKLVKGVCRIALPKHFQNVSVPDGMTVQLTPLSGVSEGLAVVSKSHAGFEVHELRGGRGTYEFDWEVKAVRRGFTDYKVLRPWDENLPPGTDRSAAMESRGRAAKQTYGITYARRP